MIFVDTNIVIDLVDPRQHWHGWSREAVASNAASGFAINHIVVAELHARPDGAANLVRWQEVLRMKIAPLSDEAARLAGAAHGIYRARGGRASILADFLIGGHCLALGATLITRDRRRFTNYFPGLSIIAPESDND